MLVHNKFQQIITLKCLCMFELVPISVFMHLNMHVFCMCTGKTACACVIVETVFRYFCVVEVWHTGSESCGSHSQKSGFIQKWECKQSNRKCTECTHVSSYTQVHTLMNTYTHSRIILPADPLVILAAAWHKKREKKEEMYNEYQSKTNQIYKYFTGTHSRLAENWTRWKNDPYSKSGTTNRNRFPGCLCPRTTWKPIKL